MIAVLVKIPGEDPRVQIIENTLDAMQAIVGGYLESVRLSATLVAIVNEDGRRLGLPQNGPFVGTFFVARHSFGDSDFLSLTPEDARTAEAELALRALDSACQR